MLRTESRRIEEWKYITQDSFLSQTRLTIQNTSMNVLRFIFNYFTQHLQARITDTFYVAMKNLIYEISLKSLGTASEAAIVKLGKSTYVQKLVPIGRSNFRDKKLWLFLVTWTPDSWVAGGFRFPAARRLTLSIGDSRRASILSPTARSVAEPSRGVSNLRSDEPQAATASSRSGTIKSTAVPWVYGKPCVGVFQRGAIADEDNRDSMKRVGHQACTFDRGTVRFVWGCGLLIFQ